MDRPSPPGGDSAPVAPSPSQSYPTNHSSVNFGRHSRPGNLSPTRPPTIAADAALWPGWTDLRVEDVDLDLFSDDGHFFAEERGV